MDTVLLVLLLFGCGANISAQNTSERNSTLEEKLDNIFSQDPSFWEMYEEVTQPPLKSYGALEKCGEGSQRETNRCVPYYNCDATTNTVIVKPIYDGSNRINIRDFGSPCDYLNEVCCGIQNTTQPSLQRPISTPPSIPKTTPISSRQVPSFCGLRNPEGVDFTLDGTNKEAEYGEFPWMMAILRNNPGPRENLLICGGSLITPAVVLTGAHCVNGLKTRDFRVRAGEWDTSTERERIPHQERNVVKIVMHEGFIAGNLYNDVALLILDRPLTKTDTVGTACLPKPGQVFGGSVDCFATGWGAEKFGKQSRFSVVLKKIELPIVPNKRCEVALRKTRLGKFFQLHRSFVCAGGKAGSDTCTGDGGSPLVCPDPENPNRYLQVGMVAWGIGCGKDGVPGVYVNVELFREWIDERLGELDINTTPYIV